MLAFGHFYASPLMDDTPRVTMGQFPTNFERHSLPEVKDMAAGQMKTGPITHGSALSRTIGEFGAKTGGSGAFGLNSVPTRLTNPNAGQLKIAKKLNTVGPMAGVVRRKAVASKVNRTPRFGYPKIKT